ncbi:MAG: exosortase-associated protein EpsI, V-type [Caulobacteraceae bacterium]
MFARREILFGGACLAAAGIAWKLEPRRVVSLLGGAKLADIVPADLTGWTSRDVSDLLAPKEPGSLMSRLYQETVGRVYQQASSGAQVMMLLAHGDSQTNQLQLHRPEVCYPAFGFQIEDDRPVILPLAAGVGLPGRSLVAVAPDRRENIIYWSRLGEYLPIDGRQQRVDRLDTAMKGIVADGLLARFSTYGDDPQAALGVVASFIPALVRAVAPASRAALIGTGRAQAMMAIPV